MPQKSGRCLDIRSSSGGMICKGRGVIFQWEVCHDDAVCGVSVGRDRGEIDDDALITFIV